MTQDFENLSGVGKPEVEADSVDWGNFGGTGIEFGDKPTDFSAQTKQLGDTYKIIGYIYPKHNYLSPSYDAQQGKVLYDELYKKAIAEGKTKYKKVTLDETGAAAQTGVEEDLKESFSLGALMALDLEAYKKIKDGVYRVNLQERNAEFYIIVNTNQLEAARKGGNSMPTLTQTEERVADSSITSSEDKTINIIKPTNLVTLAFDTATRRIQIATFDKENVGNEFAPLGFMVPFANEVKRDGKSKINYRSLFFDRDNQKVSKIGDFKELPRVVNRSYKGDRPSHIISISNEKQALEFNPTIDIDELTLVKKVAKADLPAGTTLQQMEEIPYEENAAQWEKLGITPTMLSSIRSTGSSTRNYTHAQINEMYEKGFAVYYSSKGSN